MVSLGTSISVGIFAFFDLRSRRIEIRVGYAGGFSKRTSEECEGRGKEGRCAEGYEQHIAVDF